MQDPGPNLGPCIATQGCVLAPGCVVAAGDDGSFIVSTGLGLALLAPSAPPLHLLAPNCSKPLGALATAACNSTPGSLLVAAGERGYKPAIYAWRLDGAASGGGGSDLEPELITFQGQAHNFGIQSLAFNNAGTLLASTGTAKDRQLVVSSTRTGQVLGRLRLAEPLQHIRFSPGRLEVVGINPSSILIASLDKMPGPAGSSKIKMGLHRTYALPTLSPPVKAVAGLAVAPAPARRLLATTDAGHLLHLRPAGGAVEKSVEVAERVLDMAASASGGLVACATAGGAVRIYSATTLDLLATLPAADTPTAACVACALNPSGTRAAMLLDSGRLTVFDLSDLQLPRVVEAATRRFPSAAIIDADVLSADCIASCSSSGEIHLARLPSLEPALSAPVDVRCQLGMNHLHLSALATAPGGQLLAAGDTTGRIHVYSVGTAAMEALYFYCASTGSEVTSLAFGSIPAGTSTRPLLAAGLKSGSVQLLECRQDGYSLLGSVAHSSSAAIGSLSFAYNSSRLLAVQQDCICIHSIDAAGGLHVIDKLQGLGKSPCLQLANGATVAISTAKDGSVRALHAGTGAELWRSSLARLGGAVTAIAVPDDLAYIAAATDRGGISVHAPATGKLLVSSRGSHLSITRLIATSFGIVSCGEDACVRVWQLPPSLPLSGGGQQEAASSASAVEGASQGSLPPRNLLEDLLFAGAGGVPPPPAPPASALTASASTSLPSATSSSLDSAEDAAEVPAVEPEQEPAALSALECSYAQLQQQLAEMRQSPAAGPLRRQASSRLSMLGCSPLAGACPAPPAVASAAADAPASCVPAAASEASICPFPTQTTTIGRKRAQWGSPMLGCGLWLTGDSMAALPESAVVASKADAPTAVAPAVAPAAAAAEQATSAGLPISESAPSSSLPCLHSGLAAAAAVGGRESVGSATVSPAPSLTLNTGGRRRTWASNAALSVARQPLGDLNASPSPLPAPSPLHPAFMPSPTTDAAALWSPLEVQFSGDFFDCYDDGAKLSADSGASKGEENAAVAKRMSFSFGMGRSPAGPLEEAKDDTPTLKPPPSLAPTKPLASSSADTPRLFWAGLSQPAAASTSGKLLQGAAAFVTLNPSTATAASLSMGSTGPVRPRVPTLQLSRLAPSSAARQVAVSRTPTSSSKGSTGSRGSPAGGEASHMHLPSPPKILVDNQLFSELSSEPAEFFSSSEDVSSTTSASTSGWGAPPSYNPLAEELEASAQFKKEVKIAAMRVPEAASAGKGCSPDAPLPRSATRLAAASSTPVPANVSTVDVAAAQVKVLDALSVALEGLKAMQVAGGAANRAFNQSVSHTVAELKACVASASADGAEMPLSTARAVVQMRAEVLQGLRELQASFLHGRA